MAGKVGRFFFEAGVGLGGALLIALLSYGWIAYRYFSNEPKISHDYLADLNAPILDIPEEARAWPLYCQALEKLADFPEEVRFEFDLEPAGANWPSMVEYLNQNQPALRQVREAAAMPRLGCVIDNASETDEDRRVYRGKHIARPPTGPSKDDWLLGVNMPLLGVLKYWSELLVADAHAAIHQKDGERATQDLIALLGIAEHLRETPGMMFDVLGQMKFRDTAELIRELLSSQPELLSDQQLQRLSTSIQHFGGGELGVGFELERMVFYDLVQRVYTDDGLGDGHICVERLLALEPMDVEVTWDLFLGAPFCMKRYVGRKELLAMYDKLMNELEAEVNKPYRQRDFRALRMKCQQTEEANPGYPLVNLLVGSLIPGTVSPTRAEQARDATRTTIGLVQYQRKNGAWPQSLEQLVPNYLQALPLDRFDDQPLRYRLQDGQPVLYSIGPDLADDLGTAGPDPSDWHSSLPGDFVYFPTPSPDADH